MSWRKIPRDPNGEGLNQIADIYIKEDYDMYAEVEPDPEAEEYVRRLREERAAKRAVKQPASASQSTSFIQTGHSSPPGFVGRLFHR